jgi:hypothetical protein
LQHRGPIGEGAARTCAQEHNVWPPAESIGPLSHGLAHDRR